MSLLTTVLYVIVTTDDDKAQSCRSPTPSSATYILRPYISFTRLATKGMQFGQQLFTTWNGSARLLGFPILWRRCLPGPGSANCRLIDGHANREYCSIFFSETGEVCTPTEKFINENEVYRQIRDKLALCQCSLPCVCGAPNNKRVYNEKYCGALCFWTMKLGIVYSVFFPYFIWCF